MFPVEKLSVLNTIARGAMGRRIPKEIIAMLNLLDEKSLDKIAESAGARLWKGFGTFESASADILAIFIIVRFIKLLVDTIIRLTFHLRMRYPPISSSMELTYILTPPPRQTDGRGKTRGPEREFATIRNSFNDKRATTCAPSNV